MARNFNELRAKMSPESRAVSHAKALEDLAEMKKTESVVREISRDRNLGNTVRQERNRRVA